MAEHQQKKPKRRRWPRRIAVLALLLVVALTALILWSRTEHALVTVAKVLERGSGNGFEARGLTGTLYGPIRVEQVLLRAPGSEVLIDSLKLEWSPRALLAATVAVNRLAAKSVRVKLLNGNGAGPTVPRTLRVPIRVAVQEVRIDRLTIDDGKARHEIAPVAGALTLGFFRHRLELREIGNPWARVSGTVSIGAFAPFSLAGRANLRGLNALRISAAEVKFGGRLARATVQLAPKADWAGGDLTVVVNPFDSFPIQELHVALTGVNLSGLAPAVGSTHASVDARLTATGGQLTGPFRIENTIAGRLDSGRLPVSTASGIAHLAGMRLRLADLQLTLAEAGNATGWIEINQEGYAAELATGGVRLDQLHSALIPFKPEGVVHIEQEAGAERIVARLTDGEDSLDLSGLLRTDRFWVHSARLRMPGGELTASGEISMSGTRNFSFDATLKDFDPRRYFHVPARLNGSVHASGALAPEWRADVSGRIVDSRLANAPMNGEGKLSLTRQRISVEEISARVGANRLRVEGHLGNAGDQLNVDLSAQKLGELGIGADGALRVTGWIGGSRENPAFAIEASGSFLKFKGIEAEKLSLKARALEGIQRHLDMRAEAHSLRAGGRLLRRADARVEGTRERHALRATIDDPILAARVQAQGGLVAGGRWDGHIEQLEADRPYRMELIEPFALRWRPGRLEAGAARLKIAGGELRVEEVRAGNRTLETRGRIENVALTGLVAATGAAAFVQTDLVVSGAWDIHATDSLNGSLKLVRERGDIVVAEGKPLPLKLSELRLDVVVRANAIEATLSGRGDEVGSLSIDLRTTAARRAGGWAIAPNAPLNLRSRFAVPSLLWLGRLLNAELRTGGSLSGRVDAEGTLETPQLRGELLGQNLRVRYGAAGVRLRDGNMKIELAQDRIIFRSISFRGDEGGALTASGEATVTGGKANLDLEFMADKLAAVRREDHRLVLSGRGQLRSRDGALAIEGDFTADRGLIELRDENTPRLSSDVIIVKDQPPTDAAPTRLRIDVKLNLGDAFYVKGEGLDVRMTGGVRVTLGEGDARPKAKGSVRVTEGHYRAYGQQLTVERGVLLFDGPLDNPKLDILAVRKSHPVVAGVAITGTALSPRTALYSDPPVPDAQKLQWLVFGVGPSGTGDAEFGLASSSAQPHKEDVVGFGAQIASALNVSFGQSLRTADSFVQATLDLTERVAVQGRTGSENAVMLIYTWTFD